MINYSTIIGRIRNSKFINDSFWSLLGNVISKGLSLAAGVVIARFLGKDIYGEYGIIRTTLITIAVFSTFGLGYTGTKFIAEYKNHDRATIVYVINYIYKLTLAFSCILMFVLFFTAGYIADVVLSAPHLTSPLRILSVIIVFNALTTSQIGILAGFAKFRETARINIIVGIVTFIASLILTYYLKLDGALAALLITQILNCFLNYELIRRTIPKTTYKIDNSTQFRKNIINFSIPVALQEAIYYSLTWINNLLIIKFASFGELGLFTAAMQWKAVILFIPGILRNVILSHLSESSKNEIRHSRILKITMGINASITLFAAIIVFIFSSLINRMYGVTFEGLKNLISIAVFTTVFTSMSNVLSQAYMSKGKNWLMFLLRFIRDFGVILLFFLFIRCHSFGVAESLIISGLIMNVIFLLIMFIIYQKKVRFQTVEYS